MRIVSLLALALLFPVGCTCSQKLSSVAPELIVKAPKDGDEAEGAAPGAKVDGGSKDKKPEKK